MARNMYGATSADFTLTSGGRVVPGATLTIWSARTGGTQITDLLDKDSVATTTVTSDADGSIVYYGPNNDKTVHWADSGVGSRIAIRPVDITGDPPVLSIGTVGTGAAAASLTGTSEAPVLNLTLPTAGANGVSTASIQDGAVTPIKTSGITTLNLLTANQSSFETDVTTGIGVYQATRTRVSGGEDGSYACEVVGTGVSAAIYMTVPGLTSASVGKVFTAMARVSCNTASACYLRLTFNNSGGTQISTYTAYHSGSNAYETLMVSAAAPAGTASAILYVYSNTGITVLVDKVGVWEGVGGEWTIGGTATRPTGYIEGQTTPVGRVLPGIIGQLFVNRTDGRMYQASALNTSSWSKLAVTSEIPSLAVTRLMLPTDISAVVGDTLQVFTRGVVEDPDPYTIPQRWVSAKGSAFPRFWEFTPEAGDVGSHTLTVTATDSGQNTTVTGSTSIVVKAAANPASLKTIMCVGDSLTGGMAWPEETYRRLTQSGGSPAGKGFSNYDFAGANAFPNYPTQGGFGNGGWTWASYTGASSPFWIGGQFDIKAWFDANNGGVGPDLAVILLGWNGMAASAVASGHSSMVTDAKVFLDKLHTQYPSCKVTLLGLPVPSPNGGLGTNYAATGTYSQYYDLLRYSYGRNLALKSIADEGGYSSWVRFAATASQFDAENGYPTSSTAVNVRSASTEVRQTNGIHPTTSGTLQIADVAYREIVRTFN